MQEISAADFDALPQGVRIIDVREPHELVGEFGSLPGSENVPMGTFPAAAQDWEKSTPLVCVCRSGRRSRQVCDLLVQLGFEDVSNLHGGLQDYRGRGANAA
ncbi:MAG: rhodanese-like domain-containing protein [Myxococcales bacterium]|nr:rhodanese-like domain-containing protein [Myxococcales bacterium]